jgi:serine phosphatase RsbU (regulator of sigma subunit)
MKIKTAGIHKYLLSLVLLILIKQHSFAQLDSLFRVTDAEKDLTKRTSLLIKLGSQNNENPISIPLARKAHELAISIKDDTLCGQAMALLAIALNNNGKKDSVDYYQNLALKKFISSKYDKGLFGLLFSRARFLMFNKRFDEALEINKQLIEVAERLNTPTYLGKAYERMASLFDNLNNNKKAIYYYTKSIECYKKDSNMQGLENSYLFIGNCFHKLNDHDTAVMYYKLGLDINKTTNNSERKSNCLMGIGNVNYAKNNLEEALKYYKEALSVKAVKYRDINIILNIGTVYMEMKRYKEAEAYLLEANEVFESRNNKADLALTCFNLAQLYDNLGDYKKAFNYQNTYISINDSINEALNSEAFTEIEAKYQSEKKEEQNVLLNERLKNKSLQMYFALGGILLLAGLVFLIFRGLRQNQKAAKALAEKNKIIEEKSDIVEEQNKSIKDSIKYAQRIQNAILPPIKHVQELLPNCFILYKPKDIVAGDFYWIHQIKDSSKIIIAAADCTGHGVPGAMVSVVCSNALNRTVNEFGITDTGLILDKTRELVLETFSKSESEVKDGMDISICCIDSETHQISWSGANTPLWYFEQGVLKLVKPQKQPIGKTENPSPFITNTLSLNKGDILYLITDGYADQFGGPKGKKFKYKQLEEMLTSASKLNPSEQEELLNNEFEKWRGNLEQVDDVTIIGIKL